MITTLEHGVTVHSDAEGSIIQNLDVDHKVDESTLEGMVDGRTQVVRAWQYKERYEFSVTGSGDVTMSASEDADAQITLISGGLTDINSFKYSQKLGAASEWTYSGNNWPHGTAN